MKNLHIKFSTLVIITTLWTNHSLPMIKKIFGKKKHHTQPLEKTVKPSTTKPTPAYDYQTFCFARRAADIIIELIEKHNKNLKTNKKLTKKQRRQHKIVFKDERNGEPLYSTQTYKGLALKVNRYTKAIKGIITPWGVYKFMEISAISPHYTDKWLLKELQKIITLTPLLKPTFGIDYYGISAIDKETLEKPEIDVRASPPYRVDIWKQFSKRYKKKVKHFEPHQTKKEVTKDYPICFLEVIPIEVKSQIIHFVLLQGLTKPEIIKSFQTLSIVSHSFYHTLFNSSNIRLQWMVIQKVAQYDPFQAQQILHYLKRVSHPFAQSIARKEEYQKVAQRITKHVTKWKRKRGNLPVAHLFRLYPHEIKTLSHPYLNKTYINDNYLNAFLIEACKKGDIKLMKYFWKKGADSNPGNPPDMDTALHRAVISNRLNATELLLNKKDTDPNCVNTVGMAPLNAVNSIEMLNLLLKHGASLHGKKGCKKTPFVGDASSLKYFGDIRIFKEKLFKHEKLAKTNKDYVDCNCKEKALFENIFTSHIEGCTLILEFKPNLAYQDHNGNTALHHAYKVGDSAIIDLLKNHNADTTTKNNKGLKPEEIKPDSSSSEDIFHFF